MLPLELTDGRNSDPEARADELLRAVGLAERGTTIPDSSRAARSSVSKIETLPGVDEARVGSCGTHRGARR